MLSLFATAGLLVNTGKAQTTTTTTTTTPTTAQVTTPAAVPATGDQAMAMEKFEVTGSYLPTSALVSASPVTVVDSTQVEGFGDTNILESLKRLDVAFTGNGNLGTEANNVGDGGGGESYVALRNLTTLVLMDGHRLPVSAFSGFGGANSVDVGIIPLMMIDHIDVLKDGASTVYGSDAIGGVVNIITKKNFSGVEVYGGYGSTSGGDFYTHNYGVVGGVSTDNAWITFDANDSVSSELTTLARGITTLSDAQQAAINFQPGATGDAYYSGSFPGRVASDTLAGAPEAIGAPGYNAAITSPPMWSEPSAIVPQTLAQLEAKGIYIPLSSTPAYVAAGNSTALLNTADFNNASIIPNDRRQFLLNGDDKIFGDSLEFSTQILYSQSINGGDTLAPSPLASLTGNNLSIPANNPYNPFGVLLGVGEASGAPGIRTRLIEVGHRTATNTTDTYEATFELKGKVNDALHWDTWLDYSRSNWLENVYGGANGSVLNQVLTPLLDANGNYVLNSAGLPLSVFADPATRTSRCTTTSGCPEATARPRSRPSRRRSSSPESRS
jgi:outer membrane receptor protein involved in Fe transport